MLKITVSSNTDRKDINVPEDFTIRQCLEKSGVNYSKGQTTLNANVLFGSELDNTISDMIAKYEIDGRVFLTTCVKQDNALAA